MDGTLGRGALLNATAAGRSAVEQSDASALKVALPGVTDTLARVLGGLDVPSTLWGISVASADNTAQINAWLAYCNTYRVPCRLVGATSGAYRACGIVIPGPDTILIGPGSASATLLTATVGCAQDFITVPAVASTNTRGLRMPTIRDIVIDCRGYQNTAGHCISLPEDTINSYGTGIQIFNAYIDYAPKTGIYVGKNRGSGVLNNVMVYHYGETGLTLDGASDWNCLASNFSGNLPNNNFAFAGVWIKAGANSTFIQCRSYQNLYGLRSEYASTSTPFTWISGDLSANTRNGAFIDSGNFTQAPVISGTRFTNNSLEATNTYSDIVVSRNTGAIITGNIFMKSGSTISKYLIETVTPTGPIVASGNSFNATQPSYMPYGTAVSNDFPNVPIPATDSGFTSSVGTGSYVNRWSTAGGFGANAAGQYTTALGRQVTAQVNHSVALGAYSYARRAGLAYSNAVFSTAGDTQVMAVDLLNGITTDGSTAVRLTSDMQTAGASNTFNVVENNKKLVLSGIRIVASDPASTDFAVWDVDLVAITRGTTAASVSIAAYTPVVTAKARTGALSGLNPPSIAADTTLGGLAVAATGIAGTTLHWSFSARTVELK
ncbi:hypothetical protein AwMethylo_14230 [Methylobacterium sp.]|nr:hypothetical protein AwMethylo_14230 [Methylobacterium sp.]